MSGGRQNRTPCYPAAIKAAALAVLMAVSPALADEMYQADLTAALRALGFLASLQNRPSILIGVVYHGHDAASRAQAGRVAAEFARLAGPGSATVAAVPVAAQELASQRFDALYLLSLPAEASRPVIDFVRHQGVVSVSADPGCLELGSCVLLVQARATMSVVLDTQLAKAAGARFSTVFTMLVKRK